MAAAYQTGTASSPIDLVQRLVTWLVAQGWTSDSSVTDSSGWRAHLHKSGLYVNLRAAMNESIWNYNNAAGYGVGMYVGDGYSGASNWRSQSGGPIANGTANTVGVGMNLLGAGAVAAYHFFDDGSDHITVVVEKTPGLFVHMGWGPSLVKTGYSTDFPYMYGSSSSFYNTSSPTGVGGGDTNAHVPFSPNLNVGTLYATGFFKVDATTFSSRWIALCLATGGNNQGYTGRVGRAAGDQSATFTEDEYPDWNLVEDRSWQSAFAGALLLPQHLFVNTQPANRWAPVGYPPTVFYCQAVGHGFAASSIYQVGGLNYMVFPNFAVRKAA